MTDMRGLLTRGMLTMAALLLPVCASAAVTISEVMYDLEGADTGREWVEVMNGGAIAIDLSTFKLFEANTNHGLTAVSGNPLIPPGGFAVIADDAEKFKADWPSFSGTLFQSSFSLGNVGETIGIRNSDLADEDVVAYSSEDGAAGDGKSLVRSGSGFEASAPTPGAPNAGSPGAPQSGNPPSSSQPAPSSTAHSPMGEPTKLKVSLGEDRSVIVGAGTFFEAEGYGSDGKPILGARFLWNFGDGETTEGRRVFHTYRYPGPYALFVTVSSGDSSASGRVRIEALPADVSVRTETDGSISVFNEAAGDLDLSWWFLSRGGRSFLIPKDTIALAGEGLRFSLAVLNLPAEGHAELLYPNGTIAAVSEPPTGADLIAEGYIRRVEKDVRPASGSHVASARPIAQAAPDGDSSVAAASALTLPALSEPMEKPSPSVMSGRGEEPTWPWIVALIMLMFIGIAGAWLLRRKDDALLVSAEAAEYEIFEEKDDTR